MRILVTGHQGQLARSLAERAAAFPSLVLQRAGRPTLDLEVPATIAPAIATFRPDIVVNAAAYTAVDKAEDEPERAFRINGEGAGLVAAAARTAGARTVQISTDYVFDGGSGEPYREDAPTSPIGVYGRSKLQGEERVRAADPDAVIVRTSWVYSPFGKNFVRTMMAAARTRDELSVVGDQFGNPSSALDIADGLLTMISRWSRDRHVGGGSTYHLAGTGRASWFDLAAATLEECGHIGHRSVPVRPIATADWPTRAQRPVDSTMDCSRFAADFGFAMPAWRVSLAPVVAAIAATDAG